MHADKNGRVYLAVESDATRSRHDAEKFRFQDEFALLVLFARLVRFVVLPTDRLLALPTMYVTDDVSTSRHVAVVGLRRIDVDDLVEKIRFSMLTAEVLGPCKCCRVGKWGTKHTLLRISSWLER